MPILDEARLPDMLGLGGVEKRNERQPHAPMQCRSQVQSEIKADRAAVPIGGRERLWRLSNAWRSRRGTRGKRNGNFRHGGRTKEATNASRYVNELARLVRDGD